MSIPLVVNGITFNYPTNGEVGWGVQATGWANAITNGTLQKTGGLFPLTGDLDFGPSGGLKALFFSSRTIPSATEGVFRLGNNEFIGFRNAANTGNLTIGVDASDNYRISTATTPNAAVILANGNMGIGTTTPSEKLEVNGNVKALNFIGGSGGGSSFVLKTGDTMTGPLTINSGANANPLVLRNTHADSLFAAFINGGSNRGYIGSGPALLGPGYLATDFGMVASGTLILSAGGAERMRIDTTGNVGIGTATPANTGVTKSLTIDGGAGGAGMLRFRINGADAGYLYGDGAVTQIGGGPPISLSTGGAERMRIDVAGNVGIGIDTPGVRLHVVAPASAGAAALFSSAHVSGVYAIFANGATAIGDIGAGAIMGKPAADYGINSRTGSLLFGTGAVERMRIDTTGNVGIGTTAPANFGAPYRSMTLGGPAVAGLLVISEPSANSLAVYPAGADMRFDLNGTSAFSFRTNGTERMRIDTTGNVVAVGPVYSQGYQLGRLDRTPLDAIAGYTLQYEHRGMTIRLPAGAQMFMNPMGPGATFYLYNAFNSNQSIRFNGITLRLGGTTSVGDRTLAPFGYATMWFTSNTECVISGNVT